MSREARMPSRFDEIIPRRNTGSVKHDDLLSRFGSNGLLPMWVADMDFRAPECVEESLAALVKHGVYGYHLKTDGCLGAVVAWFGRRHRYAVSPESIVFLPGVVSALSCLVQALTAPGDAVIIQPPVYPPFFSVVRSQGRRLLENPLVERDGVYTFDYADLERKASGAALLILCSPHNPVGRVWRREELERVAEICLRHRLILVSDEIHSDLVFRPHVHVPTASLAPEVERITVTCHAASKTFNLPALATAYLLIAEPDLRRTVARLVEGLHIERPNLFGLRALEAAYTGGEPWLAELLDYLAGSYAWMRERVAERLPLVGLSPMEGTYLAWLDLRRYGLSAQELHERIVGRARLALNEGRMFGTGGDGFQRMNIGCPRATVVEAVQRLGAALA
jgi:cystathionine beta-lyase